MRYSLCFGASERINRVGTFKSVASVNEATDSIVAA